MFKPEFFIFFNRLSWARRRTVPFAPSTASRSGGAETHRVNGDAQDKRRPSGQTETLRANGDTQGNGLMGSDLRVNWHI